MSWNDVWKIAVVIIAGLGGASGIVILIIKFASTMIANALMKKYQYILDEKLEKYKTSLENKKYITRTKFDAEFEIYRSLSKRFFQMALDVYTMIPSAYSTESADPEERRKADGEHYKKASASVIEAQNALNGNAPFISEDFFEKYKELLKLANLQLQDFSLRWNVRYLASQEEKEHLSLDSYERTKELQDKLDSLNRKIRKYLESLDVIE